MAKRYHTTIANAFDHITVDGVRLYRLAAYKHFDKLAVKRYMKKYAWTGPVADTVMHLTLLGGTSIPAFTSGTTGPPKHMSIRRSDLVNSARLTGDTFGLVPGDRALHCLPGEFVAGKMMLVRAFALGLDLHVIDPRGSLLNNLKVPDRPQLWQHRDRYPCRIACLERTGAFRSLHRPWPGAFRARPAWLPCYLHAAPHCQATPHQ
ncbi:MAG: hypothetical protein IPK99_03235 [Flavobacteriales bacterium]|nr:hypothetical protein [Flavobacteriales bacterium]